MPTDIGNKTAEVGTFVVCVATVLPSILNTTLVPAALTSMRSLYHCPATTGTVEVLKVLNDVLIVTVWKLGDAVPPVIIPPSSYTIVMALAGAEVIAPIKP